jgi:hypothetical protein
MNLQKPLTIISLLASSVFAGDKVGGAEPGYFTMPKHVKYICDINIRGNNYEDPTFRWADIKIVFEKKDFVLNGDQTKGIPSTGALARYVIKANKAWKVTDQNGNKNLELPKFFQGHEVNVYLESNGAAVLVYEKVFEDFFIEGKSAHIPFGDKTEMVADIATRNAKSLTESSKLFLGLSASCKFSP